VMKFSVQKFVLAAACAFLFVSVSAPSKADTVNIVLDQATILQLPEKVATLIIGNPSVADGSLQANGLLVVTGKGYGTTNLIALDARGNTLAEHILNVAGPNKDGRVTIYRGVDRETWSCAPNCERSMVLGDAPNYFETAVSQAGSRNGASAGGAAPTK
jgi:Flp pilus assembly secretin CpaC